MSTELATEYADSVTKSIWADCEAGNTFGTREFDDINEDCESDQLSAYDYLEDVLDIQYVVNAQREYVGARLLVTVGGPNVWIFTTTGVLEVTWDGRVTRQLPSDFISGLDEALAELWDMGA